MCLPGMIIEITAESGEGSGDYGQGGVFLEPPVPLKDPVEELVCLLIQRMKALLLFFIRHVNYKIASAVQIWLHEIYVMVVPKAEIT